MNDGPSLPVRYFFRCFVAVLTTLALTACHRDMYEQPKFLPDQQNHYFPDEQVDRNPVAHPVAR
jgi:hypothetical protein